MGDIESKMHSCPCHEDQVTGYNAGGHLLPGPEKVHGFRREEEGGSVRLFLSNFIFLFN